MFFLLYVNMEKDSTSCIYVFQILGVYHRMQQINLK